MTSPTESRCHTQALLDQLPAEVRGTLLDALLSGHVRTTFIVGVLGKHGLEARPENVNRHRRRLRGGTYACKCPPTNEATS